MTNSTTGRARPLVAVRYGPRCVPVMQLAEAAAGLCDLLWLIDSSMPGMTEMSDLLNRFGPVVDLEGMNVEQAFKTLADWEPDGITTYLDAGMVELACVAEDLGLPFHSPATAAALTDKARQRLVLAEAGLDMPRCHLVRPYQSPHELSAVEAEVGWPAVLKPRSAQGSRYTFLARDRAELDNLLVALGPGRPSMILEGYLPDDPARDGDPYAGYVSVESLVAEGAISHLALTGRFPPAENFRETGFFIPAALDAESRSAVLYLATRAIKALGVETGCLHTEVKFTPDGPRIIEVNGRVGGGVPEMLERAAGVSLLDLTLRVALGEPVFVDGPVATDRVGYRFFLQPPTVSATVTAVEGINDFSDRAEVDTVSLHQGPGATLDWRDGSGNHIVAVVGSTDDEEQLQAAYRLLHREVTVTYSDVRH
jgi:glutathione synthase/RimK-type ligase-like ATP-grasp enzyme